MPVQPTLPVEGAYSDLELNFIDNSPPRLWPENQDSNFGQFRKVITDELQKIANELDQLSLETFVPTTVDQISLWEEQVGVPINTAGVIAERRAAVLAKLATGGFTRAKVKTVIESYLQPYVGGGGEPPAFTPAGLVLDAGGIPLYGSVASLAAAYKVYENPPDFSYEVRIPSSIVPPQGLLTELQRISPAGITPTIDNTDTNVLDVFKAYRSDQPEAHFLLGPNANDSSLNARNGTFVNAPTVLASPGLFAHADVGTDGGRIFNGTTQYMTVPHWGTLLSGGAMTFEAWIRSDVIGTEQWLLGKDEGSATLYIRLLTDGRLEVGANNGGSLVPLARSSTLTATTIYHLVVTIGQEGVLSGGTTSRVIKIYLNNVDVTVTVATGIIGIGSGAWQIARRGTGANFWDGDLDDIAFYNYILPRKRITAHYNAGKNIQAID